MVNRTLTQDMQDEEPKYHLSLDEVGVTDFYTQISVTRGTKIYRYTLKITVVINLPSSRKGAHLSRFVEAIADILSSEEQSYYSLEEMSIHILKTLNERHPFEKGSITLDFIFFASRLTPASKKKTKESYIAKLITTWELGNTLHELQLGTYGNTVCPHALSLNKTGNTHIQRAYGEVRVKGRTEDIPDMEELSRVLDQSFSAPTYSLLKSEDELWIVNQMHKNPLFVEDVTRNILEFTKEKFSHHDLEIQAKTVSQESIHKHNVVSKGSIRINKKN